MKVTIVRIFFFQCSLFLVGICRAETNLHNGQFILETVQLADAFSKCPGGFFHCNTSMQCVPQSFNCDGSANCNDASDEWNCENEIDTKFWDHFFRKQPFARNDNVPSGICYWNISWLECPCRGNEVLCRFQNLQSIPRLLPESGLRLLDLTGNRFSSLDETFFEGLSDVETIVLKFCEIDTIYPNAFKRLAKIKVENIYLDQNNICYLPDNLFPANNTLKLLILSGNIINILYSHNFLNLDLLTELDLRHNQIEVFGKDVFQPLANLEILYLNENRIHCLSPGMFPNLKSLHTLSLAYNLINSIERDSFPLPQLEHLFLAGNRLTEIKSETFCYLNKLKGLHLNDNNIRNIENGAFKCLSNLTSLLLAGNKFKTLSNLVLQNLTSLSHIYFSWFHLCRAATHVRVCEPKGDGISSAYHLLDNIFLRGSVWVMAAVAILGNTIVLLGRYFPRKRTNAEHSLYIRHLAASDLLMGIYLAVIASADINFRGKYIIHEEAWRRSTVCTFCGFLSTLSCQSSTLLLSLVTWDRLMSVTRPLQTRNTSTSKALTRLIIMWTLSFILASLPLSSLSYFGEHFYGNNGVCLSIHIHDPYAKGWEYSATLFIFINTLSLLFITFSYLRMLQAIRDSGRGMRSNFGDRKNIVVGRIFRFAIIIIIDCACWLPIIGVKVAALYGAHISPSLYAWLAVLILPVNSALNPVLYTLTTTTFKQQINKYMHAFSSCSLNSEARSEHNYDSCQMSASLGHFGNASGPRRLLNLKISTV